MRGGEGRIGEKVQGLRCANWQVQKRQRDVKNSIEMEKPKNLYA